MIPNCLSNKTIERHSGRFLCTKLMASFDSRDPLLEFLEDQAVFEVSGKSARNKIFLQLHHIR